MEIILIAAMASNRVIGDNNRIPWHIPEEMQHFKASTMAHAVIMGRKTFDSIGKALPGRTNVVLSNNPNLQLPGCHVAHSLHEGLGRCSNHTKIFIIGGRSLYQQAMENADTILLSIVNRKFEGDTYFPEIPVNRFQLISKKEMGTEQIFTLHTFQCRIPKRKLKYTCQKK